MKEKSILERHPYLFKLESGDMAWYESMGFKKGLDISTIEMEKEAKEFALSTIRNPEHIETIEACAETFMDGARWYISNSQLLKTLSEEKYGNAVVIAQIIYAKEICNNAYEDPDDEWTIGNAFDYICSIRSFFLSGIEWAENSNCD